MFRITEDPSPGSLIQNTFKYFIILIVSTYCIFVHELDNKVFVIDARCKHEELHINYGDFRKTNT